MPLDITMRKRREAVLGGRTLGMVHDEERRSTTVRVSERERERGRTRVRPRIYRKKRLTQVYENTVKFCTRYVQNATRLFERLSLKYVIFYIVGF